MTTGRPNGTRARPTATDMRMRARRRSDNRDGRRPDTFTVAIRRAVAGDAQQIGVVFDAAVREG